MILALATLAIAGPDAVLSLQLDAANAPFVPAWSRYGPGLFASGDWALGERLTVGFSQSLHLFDPALGVQLFGDTQTTIGVRRLFLRGRLESFSQVTAGVHLGYVAAETSEAAWGYAASYAAFGATPLFGTTVGLRWWLSDAVGITAQAHVPIHPMPQMWLDGQGRLLTVGASFRASASSESPAPAASPAPP